MRGLPTFEEERQPDQAIALLVQALVLFEQLGAPERAQARRALARLQEKMGAEAFESALQAGTPQREPFADKPTEPAASESMTIAQALEVVVDNTVTVLREAPEKRAEWGQVLEELRSQVKAQGLDEFALFLEQLSRLVEGTMPEVLTPHVPPAFQEAWEELVRRIEHQRQSPPGAPPLP
ncbi:MAG: hypothetical protein M5U01_10260 [Ardenticatenaceae bacterium]|nr:hypothetical protein [Ardenticatenaceae bacterium]